MVCFRELMQWKVSPPSTRHVCPSGGTVCRLDGVFNSPVHPQGVWEGEMGNTGVGYQSLGLLIYLEVQNLIAYIFSDYTASKQRVLGGL